MGNVIKMKSNVFNNSWTVTIVGTTLGVLIAFFLNNWKESYQDKKRIDSVLIQIKQELLHNKEVLKQSYDRTIFVEPLHAIFKRFEGDTLLMSLSDKANYLNEYGGSSVLFLDSTLVNQNIYMYTIDVKDGINLEFRPVKIGSVSWKLAQQLGVIQSMPFSLLKSLEELYAAQIILEKREEKMLDYLGIRSVSPKDIKLILNHYHVNREIQLQIIGLYDEVLKEF